MSLTKTMLTLHGAAILFGVILLCGLPPALARADQSVPEGCDAPKIVPNAHTFYIDPAKGSADGDGSQGRPWRTLAEVLDPKGRMVATDQRQHQTDGSFVQRPNGNPGPIKPGDTLVLASGDHGDVKLTQYVNSAFISVVAGPGQTPLVQSLRAIGSSHWLFRGLKFQKEMPQPGPSGAFVEILDHGFAGPGDNFILESNSISTRDDVSGWADQDWVDRPFIYGFKSSVHCLTLAGNHFFYLRNGAAIFGDSSLVENNRFEAIGNDSINIAASNLTIRHNTITDGRHTPAEGLHPDAIQGWSFKGATNRNVIIDSNLILNPKGVNENGMQGISIFDGSWDGIVISNNVVVTNAFHSIALYGARNALIINNSVASPNPTARETWIKVHNSKENPDDISVIVRNNITPQIVIDSPNAVVDHNLTKYGVRSEREAMGRFNHGGPDNLLDHQFDLNFREFEPQIRKVDLRLKPDSRAIGAGSPDRAPPTDIDGHKRIPPIDIGAYAKP
jgi:hypothetical protein